jgi:hypothetical protein
MFANCRYSTKTGLPWIHSCMRIQLSELVSQKKITIVTRQLSLYTEASSLATRTFSISFSMWYMYSHIHVDMMCDQKQETLIQFVLKTSLFRDFLRPNPSRFGHPFCSGPSNQRRVLANSSLAMVWTTQSELVFKLYWDNKMSASSDFSLRQRKKPPGVLNGE